MFRRKKEKQNNNSIHNESIKLTLILEGVCTIHLITTVSTLRESLNFESIRLQTALRDPELLKKLLKEDYRAWEDKRKLTVRRNSEKENWENW